MPNQSPLENLPSPGRRTVPRQVMESGDFRMLGSLSRPALSFEYVLVDVSDGGARIRVDPEHSEHFALGALLHTHLPFRFGMEFHDVGAVVRREEQPGGIVLGIALKGRVPLQYPVFMEFRSGEEGSQFQSTSSDVNRLFHRVLKDAYYLKRGILIYLDHLIPIFGRSAAVRRRLSGDEAVNHFQATRGLLVKSLEVLDGYVARTDGAGFRARHLAPDWDWSALRRAVTVDFALEALAMRFKTREVAPYLRSIRLLDHRLYTNFNTLVALHYLG